MHRYTQLTSLLTGLVLTPSLLQGVVINDDVGLANAATYGSQFDAVVGIGGTFGGENYTWGTGVLIDPYTVLTAAHVDPVIGETIFFGADASTPSQTRTIAGVANNFTSGSYGDGSDLALVFFSSPVTDINPYSVTYDYANIVGKEITMVGYGHAGIGSEGVATDPTWGDPLENNIKYAGTNTIDYMSIDARGPRYWADFDSGLAEDNELGSSTPTQYEAIIGAGDSGGPLLVEQDGEWVVLGITNAGIVQSGENDGEYGEQSIWTGLVQAESWLDAYAEVNVVSLDDPTTNVPEPSSALLLITGLSTCIIRRKRR